MSLSLRTYFVLIFSAFVIIFTAIVSFVVTKESSESVEKQISDSLTEKAYQMADQLDSFMWTRYGEIKILTQLQTLKQPNNQEEIQNLLDGLKSNFPSFSWIGFTDASGNVQAATDNILVGSDISKRPVFKEAKQQTFVGDVHEAVLLAELLPNPNGELLQFVDISSPVFDEDNEFAGVLAAHLSWAWASEVRKAVIQPLQKNEKNLDMFIISKKDNTVLLGPQDMIGQQLQLRAITQAQTGENYWSLEEWPDGNQYLTGYALANGFLNYPGLNWTILVRQPEQVAFSSVNNLRNKVITIGLISSILFGLLGWCIATIISRPLRQLAVTAEKLRNNEKVEIPVKEGIRDIKTLAISLRELIFALTKTESDLGKMEQKAQHDNLTGLPNRFALEEFLKKLDSSNDNKYAFLFLDLDQFKKVNDQFGHHHGDKLLKEIASRLKANIRNSEFLCRMGGDEFVIILDITKQSSSNEVDKIGQRIIESINQPITIEGNTLQIGCSIGVAFWPIDDNSLYQVIRYADMALYNSKAKGKNQISYYR
ncbi:diguanylate cyclase [Aquibacillus halophilus]|uniref:Diguanylate cyclase n=1 Tax=Aquibacillus halophilus TaxID=930132 RepID=A0A6A8DJ88_9BACI|nr:diguanylate cyclase [Aquibacillus halophilus]MRH44536.1 diguanylate cyclase [Aquibacillus halophilus]